MFINKIAPIDGSGGAPLSWYVNTGTAEDYANIFCGKINVIPT
jgi:hypothetical protein